MLSTSHGNRYTITFLVALLLGGQTLFAKPLLISAGGYGSCPIVGSTDEMRASTQIAALAQKLNADLLKVCFALSSTTVISKSSWTGKSRRQSVASFLKELSRLDRPDGIFLVGQSYGGWLVMRVALTLPTSAPTRGLATVDPISPIHCAPATLVGSFVAGPHDGCLQAPPDLNGQFNEVRSRVKSWTHFFQTSYRYLHSSLIREADQISEMDYPPTMLPFGAHMFTETDDRVWDKIGEAFNR